MTGDINWNEDKILLIDFNLPNLPDSPDCPYLVKLEFQSPGLIVIPPTFFKRMPVLQALDLSNTNIVSLPSSISCLCSLQEFVLKDCCTLKQLPTEIGLLTKLKLFDINGTELMFIPKELGKLKDLEVLRVSLSQYAKSFIKAQNESFKKIVIENVVPRKMISELKNLKELCISVHPEAEWWEEEVKDIQNELCDLVNLQTLGWYLPTNKVLQQFILLERNRVPIFANLSNFKLTVGEHPHLSCLPHGLEKKFLKFENCLKWINTEEHIDEVSMIMASAEALFLSRHWTLKKLSTFHVPKLKYCLIAECNEMETLVEVDVLSIDEESKKVGLELLRYLSIHCMNKLQSIWKGPIGKDSLSKLKVLALHSCPELTSVFSPSIAQNLKCLTEITVEDCPKVVCLFSNESHNVKYDPILSSLDRIILIDLPELVSIFGDLFLMGESSTLLIYNCLKLRLSTNELPHIKKIEGEAEWWNDLDCDKSQWENIFVPVKEMRDLIEQLSEATNSLEHFYCTLTNEYEEKNLSKMPDKGDQVNASETSMEKKIEISPSLEEYEEKNSSKMTDITDQVTTAIASIEKEIETFPSPEEYEEKNSSEMSDIGDQVNASETSMEKKIELSLSPEEYEEKNSSKMTDITDQVITAEASMEKEIETFPSPEDVEKRPGKGILGGSSHRLPMVEGRFKGFDEEVNDLKEMVLKDSALNGCSVVVVSGPEACGKTTLATMFCHDSEVQGKFGGNIYFAIISRTYDLKVIIKNLLPRNQLGKLNEFASDKVAIQAWRSFLGEHKSGILLVLDDVWSESVITDFKFKSPGYKILVTSRKAFTQFKAYQMPLVTPDVAKKELRPRSSGASGFVAGVLLGDAVSKLLNHILRAIKKTWYYDSRLKEMKKTVERMIPMAEHLDKLNKELDRPKEENMNMISMLNHATEVVLKCNNIGWDITKKYRYTFILYNVNASLRNLVHTYLPGQIARKEMLRKVSSSGWRSQIPLEKGFVIGFEDRVRDLKAMVLKDSPNGDCSVIVVSAAGGSGKTTLVKMLCHDPQIKERFGENIYYVTVSQNYNPKVIVTQLLLDTNIQDAIQQWESFLGQNESEILLVLDDVWSDEVIDDFKFKLPRYKILVTSRITFRRFKIYQLQVLNDQDSTRLFRCSAFSPESGTEDRNIPDDLFGKLVKCCKNHPLLLSVIGRMLNGAHLASWELMLKNLSEEKKPFLDMNETILECLEKSLLIFNNDPEMKQCFMHLGLFPEYQKIAATTLTDMWVHLYNHDGEGWETMNIVDRLSSKNLATLMPLRKHSSAIVNPCLEEFVTQHDMMRELAIRLSSEEPIEDRDILIINAYGKDLSQLPQTVKARVLSISTVMTDETLPSSWNKIKAPKAEVFVLNYMLKVHPLPKFVHKKNRLKVLIITNYGYYFSEIQNFPAPKYLSGLTRIRLDHVSISSTICTTILMLKKLRKLSLIMCKIGDSFNEGILNKLINLLEIDIDSCDDLVTFPAALCNSVHLKKLSITNCHELTSLSVELGKLSNLEVLRVASCSKFIALPESVTDLKKLRIIDISHCVNLCELPHNIGELRSLRSINATGCMSLLWLPKSVEKLDEIDLLCDEEASYQLCDFKNVKVKVVVEDPVDTFFKINPSGH